MFKRCIFTTFCTLVIVFYLFVAEAQFLGQRKDYELHEWGVLVGCSDENSYFLTSRPQKTYMVKEPVIYIHSKDKEPFSVKVTFKEGNPTDTYPKTTIDKNTVTWQDVTFLEKDIPVKGQLKPRLDYLPMEDILEVINDVDADYLEYQDQRARFLFYEGDMPFKNNIDVKLSSNKKEAVIVNNGTYSVHNVILVVAKKGNFIFGPHIYIAKIVRLRPNEKIEVELDLVERDVSIEPDLIYQGFTNKEAKSFSKLWQKPFFYYSNTSGWANLIYRLPQEEYDKLLKLEVSPKPKKIIRSLYVLIHLGEHLE